MIAATTSLASSKNGDGCLARRWRRRPGRTEMAAGPAAVSASPASGNQRSDMTSTTPITTTATPVSRPSQGNGRGARDADRVGDGEDLFEQREPQNFADLLVRADEKELAA